MQPQKPATTAPPANPPPAKGKQIAPIDAFRGDFARMADQFKRALPPQVSHDKFMRVVETAVGANPELLAANRMTLYSSSMKAAQDGLLPDGREAALVIFGASVVYMPMVAGILKKVRNSGELASITAMIVHKNDKFKRWVDDQGEHLEHEPVTFGDKGDAIGVYAQARTKDGAVYLEALDSAQVAAVKTIAKSKTVWEGPFAHEMWKKTAIRRLSKRLPMSTDLEAVILRDNELFDLEKGKKTETPKNTSARLNKIVKGREEATPAPEKQEADVNEHAPIDAEVVDSGDSPDDQVPI